MVLPVLRVARPGAPHEFLRNELGYLEQRGLVTLERPPARSWRAKLTAQGRGVVEYTVECPLGIDRPPLDSRGA